MPSIRIDNVVPSLAGQMLAAHQKLNKPYTPKINSTLNQKFDIHSSVVIPPSQVYGIKYLVAGTGGLQLIPGAGGKPLVKYRPTHFEYLFLHYLPALYRTLPSQANCLDANTVHRQTL
jgi:hypothetical protein